MTSRTLLPPSQILPRHPSLGGRGGFTMVGIAILVVIIGMTVAALVPDTISNQRDKIEETQRRMRVIRDAIYTYQLTSTAGRIPCTSSTLGSAITVTSAGMSETACGASGMRVGAVPTNTLNLPSEYAMDAWGNKFRYVVEQAFTDNSPATPASITPPSLDLKGNGGPARYPDGSLMYVPGSINHAPIALIISSGQNGLGAFQRSGVQHPATLISTPERENQEELGPNSIFMAEVFSESAAAQDKNDDLVEAVFTYKNCVEPVTCAFIGATQDLSVPVGCVMDANAVSYGRGENIHTDLTTRTKLCRTSGTRYIRCNNGVWVDTNATGTPTGGACA